MRFFSYTIKQNVLRLGFVTLLLFFLMNITKLMVKSHGTIPLEAGSANDSRHVLVGGVESNKQRATTSLFSNTSDEDSGPCPIDKSKLRKREKTIKDVGDFRFLEAKLTPSEIGGRYRPKDCQPAHRLAIIVPFRDRDSHLKIFLHNVIPKLQRQRLDFTIFIVEQSPETNFNRGMIRNIGFIEASKLGNFDCYVFNDVDTIMEDDRNFIRCGSGNTVRHLVTGVDRDKYKLKYSTLVGGIIAFTKEQFEKVNGYSNFFFMWGAEDDEIEQRIKNRGMTIARPAAEVGFVTTLNHVRDPEIKSRFDILWSRSAETAKLDGLNSLKYKVKLIEKRKLYTWIYVSIDETEILKDLHVPKKKGRV